MDVLDKKQSWTDKRIKIEEIEKYLETMPSLEQLKNKINKKPKTLKSLLKKIVK